MAIDNLNQDFTPLTEFPNRINYTTSRAYALAVATWLSQEGIVSTQIASLIDKLEVMINQINTTTDSIDTSLSSVETMRATLEGIANFKGEWSATYNNGNGYAQADSVEYTDGNIYISKIENNTAEPTAGLTTAEWYFLEKLSASDLKTVGGESLVGTGNIETGLSASDFKTVGGESLVGTGNIETGTKLLFEKSLFGGL